MVGRRKRLQRVCGDVERGTLQRTLGMTSISCVLVYVLCIFMRDLNEVINEGL